MLVYTSPGFLSLTAPLPHKGEPKLVGPVRHAIFSILLLLAEAISFYPQIREARVWASELGAEGL